MMTRETEIEYNRWKILCDEARAAGIDVDKPKFSLMIRAISMWGESLVALRLTQTPEVRQQCANQTVEQYTSEKKKPRV